MTPRIFTDHVGTDAFVRQEALVGNEVRRKAASDLRDLSFRAESRNLLFRTPAAPSRFTL
jgi:hypothetical protein